LPDIFQQDRIFSHASCYVSLERRWSSPPFRYGYLVTT
jgi:hypothetical protein